MVSRNDFVKNLNDLICNQYCDSISRVAGAGSFFFNNMNSKYSIKEDRTIDLHLIVNDLESFYSSFDPTNFGLSSNSDLEKLLKLNNYIPSYYMSSDESYRMTITPLDKFSEWTEIDSDIGYFLSGRYQKPMRILSENKEDKAEIKDILEKNYDLGVDLALKTLPLNEYKIDDIISHLYFLSYVAEGPRSIEAKIKKKPQKIFESMKEESLEIYENRFTDLEFNRIHSYNGNFKYNPIVGSTKYKRDLNNFKEFAIPRYAYVISLLANINDNPQEYAQKKILRGLNLNDESNFNLQIIGTPLATFANHLKTKALNKLPESHLEILESFN